MPGYSGWLQYRDAPLPAPSHVCLALSYTVIPLSHIPPVCYRVFQGYPDHMQSRDVPLLTLFHQCLALVYTMAPLAHTSPALYRVPPSYLDWLQWKDALPPIPSP